MSATEERPTTTDQTATSMTDTATDRPAAPNGDTTATARAPESGPAAALAGKPEKKPLPRLAELAVDLTARAREGIAPEIHGRDHEVERVIESLVQRERRGVVLLGRPGSGRSAVVEALAARVAAGDVPDELQGRAVLHLHGSQVGLRLASGLPRLKQLMVQVAELDAVLFVSHVEAQKRFGTNELWDDILLAFAAHPGRLITARDGAFDAAHPPHPDFTSVPVEPLGDAAVQEALRSAAASRLGDQHPGVRAEFLDEAVALAHEHDRAAQLPDLAIAVVDLLGTRARLAGLPADLAMLRTAFADVTGRSESRTGTRRTDGLASRLRRRVIGQDEVIEQVVDRLSVAELGHRVRSDRPRAVMLFAGATGVGKTELARALAAELDPEDARMMRLDMAEYGTETDVWKIISPPPGILGHGTASPLLKTVAEHPESVVLLDEVEKAHPAVHRLFLRVMDEGVLTQSNGAEVRFGKTTIVMTTNALSPNARRSRGFGFEPDRTFSDVSDLDGVFPPEFIGRLDAVCRFRCLDVGDAERIVAERLIPDWLRAHPELRLTIAPGVARTLAVAGHEPERGVRELERVVERHLMLPVARAVRAGEPGRLGLVAQVVDGHISVARAIS